MRAATICLDIALEDPDARRIVRHQFVNLVHVVHAELQLIERMSGRLNAFRDAIRLCETAIRAFTERNTAIGFADDLFAFRSRIVAPVTALEATGTNDQDTADIDDARQVLLSVIDAADVRVQGILARHGIDRPWQPFDFASIAGIGGISLESPSPTDEAPGSRMVQAPIGFGLAVSRLVSCLGNRTPAQVGLGASDRSPTVSISTPGATLPGTEFVECKPIDYQLLRSDPEQAAKLALLGVYFVIFPSGSIELAASESSNDTLRIILRPVA